MARSSFLSLLFLLPSLLHGQVEHHNLSYIGSETKDSLRMLNLVLPELDDPFPLLVWIGGGAWSYVDRNQEMDLARQFSKSGIGVAAVGHRLSNPIWQDSSLDVGLQHPIHIRDIAAALRWIFDQASTYGYQKSQIFVGGFSSGAHLAALLCTNEKYLREVNLDQQDIRGILPVSGTYDIFDYHAVFANGNRPEMAETHVEAIFGSGDLFQDASPVHFRKNLKTPMLLISDTGLFNYTHLFTEKLREISYRDFEVLHVQQLGHADLWKDLSHNEQSIYRKHMENFIWREVASEVK